MAAKKKRAPKLDLNPSSADRWTTCTASPKFVFDNWDRIPPSDTFFNQEGTTAHEVGAAFLQNRKPDEADKEKCPVPVNAEMQMHGWDYAEYVQNLVKPGGRLLVEQKLPLFYMPGRNAIVDAGVINPDEIHIVDLKYGEGIIVDPEGNLQESIYLGCILKSMAPVWPGPDMPVFLHIYQPRGRNAEEPFKVWETTLREVETTMLDKIQFAARDVLAEKNLQFLPSDKACQWCPAKGFCEARQRYLTQDIEALSVISDQAITLPAPDALSMEQIAAVLKHGSNIGKWINDVAGYALSFMKGGGKIPGNKLVLSRGGNRYWSNPAEAAKLLLKDTVLKENEVYERKIIGPAAAEKLLGKHKFTMELTNMVAKPPGSPVIAPVDDKREEYAVDGSSEFSPVVELEEF